MAYETRSCITSLPSGRWFTKICLRNTSDTICQVAYKNLSIQYFEGGFVHGLRKLVFVALQTRSLRCFRKIFDVRLATQDTGFITLASISLYARVFTLDTRSTALCFVGGSEIYLAFKTQMLVKPPWLFITNQHIPFCKTQACFCYLF